MRLLVVFGLFPFALLAQGQVDGSTDTTGTELDTLQLKEHRVRGVLPQHDRGLAATGTTLDSLLLNNYERSSIQGALAWVPGVQMDTRGLGGSVRLSIRGSMLRAPFGVRGVKVYWGPFPITLADGTTPLELLDPSIVGGLSVVRSVASPVFGSAPAGLLIAELPVPQRPGPNVSFAYTLGPHDFHRGEASMSAGGDRRWIAGGATVQANNGYRHQEASRKHQFHLLGGLSNARASVTCAVTYQSAYWELPGSLDSITAINSPTSANAWSERINAHVDKSQVFGGVHAEQRTGRNWLLRATVHGQHIDKKNPYGTSSFFSGLKDETYRAFGARLSAGGQAGAGGWRFGWELGAEALYEVDDLLDSAYNANAELIAARTDARFVATNATPYLVAQAQVREQLWLFAGVGGEVNSYTADDRREGRKDEGIGRESAWPHAGARVLLTRGIHFHARYAEGVSRPTITEVWTGASLNTTLRPEHVQEVEAAVHAATADSALRFTASGYQRNIRDRIVTVADPFGDPYTINSGSAGMQGVEVEGSLQRPMRGGGWFMVRLFGAAQELRSVSHDPNGTTQRLAGVAPLTGGIALQLHGWRRWQALVSARYTGDPPAIDGGSAVVPGALLGSARLGYELKFARRSAVEVFVLGENLLDQRYSSWVQVNDPGARYHNPAPGRSFFGGLRVRLR